MTDATLMPSPDAPIGFPFEEKRARFALGLNKDECRALRKAHLTDSDFAIHKKRLFLSAAAFEKLQAAVGTAVPQKSGNRAGAPFPLDSTPKKSAPTVETLLVVRNDLANTHLILACAQTDNPDCPKKPLRVRVRDTTNFTRRMEIPAVLVDGYADLYDLARALPRSKGKW